VRSQALTSIIPLLFHEEADRSRIDNVAGAWYPEYVPKVDAEKPKMQHSASNKKAWHHMGKRASKVHLLDGLDLASIGYDKVRLETSTRDTRMPGPRRGNTSLWVKLTRGESTTGAAQIEMYCEALCVSIKDRKTQITLAPTITRSC
jgi:hypothetical protein